MNHNQNLFSLDLSLAKEDSLKSNTLSGILDRRPEGVDPLQSSSGSCKMFLR